MTQDANLVNFTHTLNPESLLKLKAKFKNHTMGFYKFYNDLIVKNKANLLFVTTLSLLITAAPAPIHMVWYESTAWTCADNASESTVRTLALRNLIRIIVIKIVCL